MLKMNLQYSLIRKVLVLPRTVETPRPRDLALREPTDSSYWLATFCTDSAEPTFILATT